MTKPILVLDFDGVIHSYTSPWTHASDVRDGPVPGAMDALVRYAWSFEVHVLSSRSGQFGGPEAMKDAIYRWLMDAIHNGGIELQGLPEVAEPTIDRVMNFVEAVLKWPVVKPPAFLTIDDRAMTFEGKWPLAEELLKFKPWNKRG